MDLRATILFLASEAVTIFSEEPNDFSTAQNSLPQKQFPIPLVSQMLYDLDLQNFCLKVKCFSMKVIPYGTGCEALQNNSTE